MRGWMLYAVISYLRVWRNVKESMPFDPAEDRNDIRIRMGDWVAEPPNKLSLAD